MYFWTDPTSKEYGSPFYLPNFLLSKSASFFPSMVRAYKQSPAIRGGFIRGFSYKGRQIRDSPYSDQRNQSSSIMSQM